jgi:hypothetical protein
LQWASHVLEEPVVNLKAIQDVKFVKNILWRIDDYYFSEWEGGQGPGSYSQVLETIGRYFKEEIGTDISQHLLSLNVYKNVKEVWELLLGIAIKGNNRNNNISLIFGMEHSMQAELVKIVTDIIEKFGQNTAQIDAEDPVEDHKENSNDRQMVIELLQEN